jgi:hypothetical protein
VCTAIEWESSVAATATTDRECTVATVFTAVQFETAAKTSTSDRTWQITMVCDPGKQWETTAATDTSDRQCQDYTVCGDDFTASVQPTATSDRECVQVDDCQGNACDNGECVDGIRPYTCECQSGASGEYCDCNAGTYSLNPAGIGSPCLPFTTCDTGFWESTAPTS